MCECEEPSGNRDFYIKEMGIKNVKIGSTHPIDTTMFYPFDSIVKSIFIERQEIAFSNHTGIRISFLPNAYGCEPAAATAKQKIASIYLIANSAMMINSNSFSIGDTLNQFFKLNTQYRDKFMVISEFIKSQSAIFSGEEFWLKFTENPNNEVNLDFEVHLDLTDGSVFRFKNQRLKIK